MASGAGGSGEGQIAEPGKGPISLVAEMVEVLFGFSGIAPGSIGGVLIVGFEGGIIFFDHAAGTPLEDQLRFREVGEDFTDGPAIKGGLPVEIVTRGRDQDFFDDDGSLLKKLESGK
jgi:hypothetical protein